MNLKKEFEKETNQNTDLYYKEYILWLEKQVLNSEKKIKSLTKKLKRTQISKWKELSSKFWI